MTRNQEKILLYWSGELDPEDIAEIEALLAHDASAQEYLQELNELEEDMGSLQMPQAKPGLIASVLAEEDKDENTAASVQSFPIPFIKTITAIAALFFIGAIVFLSNRTATSTAPITKMQSPPEVKTTPSHLSDSSQAAPLSKRLFNSRPTFASALSDRKKRRTERRRYDKLSNTKLNKI